VQEAAAGLEQGTQGLLGAGGPKLQPSHGFGNAGGDTAIETDAPRVGGGVFMSRVFGSYFQLLGPLSVQAEFGFSWSFRKDVNPALDYGATIGWAPTSWWGIFTSGEARTFLLSNDSGLASVQSQERQSGDTLVVVSPGVWLAPSAVWSLTVSPQLPVTDARDFTWGLSASTAWRFD